MRQQNYSCFFIILKSAHSDYAFTKVSHTHQWRRWSKTPSLLEQAWRKTPILPIPQCHGLTMRTSHSIILIHYMFCCSHSLRHWFHAHFFLKDCAVTLLFVLLSLNLEKARDFNIYMHYFSSPGGDGRSERRSSVFSQEFPWRRLQRNDISSGTFVLHVIRELGAFSREGNNLWEF